MPRLLLATCLLLSACHWPDPTFATDGATRAGRRYARDGSSDRRSAPSGVDLASVFRASPPDRLEGPVDAGVPAPDAAVEPDIDAGPDYDSSPPEEPPADAPADVEVDAGG